MTFWSLFVVLKSEFAEMKFTISTTALKPCSSPFDQILSKEKLHASISQVLIMALILTCQVAHAQVKGYFLPSDAYINETFLFETKWKTEKGEDYQSKMKLRYFLDPSRNYKKYSETQLVPSERPKKLMPMISSYSVKLIIVWDHILYGKAV